MTLALQRRLFGSINRIKWQPGDVDRLLARFGETDAADLVRLLDPDPVPIAISTPATTDAPTSAGTRSYTFTISTPTIDSYGDSVAVDGWKLDTFQSNPTVLWAHDGSALPIGKAIRTWIAGKKLKSTVELAPAAANPAAEQVRALIEGGYLRATSVGFVPLRWTFTQDKNRPFGIDFSEVRLLEWSLVNTPANSDCLIDAGQVGGTKSADDLDLDHEARQREMRTLAVHR